jgi:predicted Na+-dependent transporter
VILAMLIERFSLVAAEEGLVAALKRGGFSLVISLTVYPVFVSENMEFLAFTYPELILVVMGLLVFLGSYTGYRVTDWLRFRQLARRIVEDAS